MTQPLSTHGVAIRVRGQVQGVGFRPFIWQVAHELNLLGEVLNDSEGVLIFLQCDDNGARFLETMHQRLPPLARVDKVEVREHQFSVTPTDFVITASKGGQTNTRIAPDTASCRSCLDETFAKQDRRFGYPFTNCTHCGPRFSIIKDVPYDRPYTSMATFPLCADCQQEYDNPADRRFHAQPNACPKCGPQITLIDANGNQQAQAENALNATVKALQAGKVVAVKGLGGYHLAVDATNPEAVAKLRLRKHRPAKPFALMARDLNVIERFAVVNPVEQEQLQSGAAPIVLLNRLDQDGVNALAQNVAPNMATLGVMLPSNPLQHLLLAHFDMPLVMTSGNASGKPPCIDDNQALLELGGIADMLLVHNRAIVNRVDDSIVRVDNGSTLLLRRARGFVPSPIDLPQGFENADGVLAYGADLKNTFCYLKGGQALISAHLGDLSDLQLRQAYIDNLSWFGNLFSVKVQFTAADSHPNYVTTDLAKQHAAYHSNSNCTLTEIQHHHAHMTACMIDNQIPLDTAPMLALILDGLGWGGAETDHQLWGAELLYGDYRHAKRLDGLAPMPLLGGDLAAKQPWRNLLVQLEHHVPDWQSYACSATSRLQQKPISVLRKGIKSGVNCPLASSAGRLFDAVAALLTDCFETISFEGEAAMVLESMAWQALNNKANATENIATDHNDLTQMWLTLLTEVSNGTSPCEVALIFHQQLASILLKMITSQSEITNVSHVVLSGGVMQNRLLVSILCAGIRQLGLTPLTHKQVPANDGGLSLGQAAIAWAQQKQGGLA